MSGVQRRKGLFLQIGFLYISVASRDQRVIEGYKSIGPPISSRFSFPESNSTIFKLNSKAVPGLSHQQFQAGAYPREEMTLSCTTTRSSL